jgi:starvation-inducible outer membrane lipoprotein
VPVDSSGYFSDQGRSEGRYFAVLPQDEAMLDPEVYRPGRRVTLAGRFTGLRKERIEEMDYIYPVFRIVQIYLWPKEDVYYYPYPGYYYDPWYYPYPYFYGDFWWGYPYSSYYPYYPYYPYYYPRRGYPPYRSYPQERAPVPGRVPTPERTPAPAPHRH